MEWEKRTFRTSAELRDDGDENGGDIVGLGAPFFDAKDTRTEYRLWDNAVERFMPGAFDETVKQDDIRASFNHDLNQLLGRTKSGTLSLSVGKEGLRYHIKRANTQVFADVSEMISRGDVDGSSVWMRVLSETWRTEQQDGEREMEIREINEVKLFEVGPVADPAYTATSADTREARSRFDAWKESEQASKPTLFLLKKELDLIELSG